MSADNKWAIPRLAQCEAGDLFNSVTVIELAAMVDPKHPGNELVTVKCSQPKCETRYKCARAWEQFTSCDPCREAAIKAEALQRAKTYWESICPDDDTDKGHPAFPRAQYTALKEYMGEQSLFFFGPSGEGKTRLALLLLKRCLHWKQMHVGIMWPEDLKAVKGARDVLDQLKRWGKYDLLLMDDALLSGAADDAVSSFLKDLLDYRMRYKRHHIITSQIGGDDYAEQANKWGNITTAEKQRVAAILRRVKETCKVISFAPVAVLAGERSF